MVYKCFDKKTFGAYTFATSTWPEPLRSETLTTHALQNIFAGGTVMLNQELVEELHEPIIRKFKKRKVH